MMKMKDTQTQEAETYLNITNDSVIHSNGGKASSDSESFPEQFIHVMAVCHRADPHLSRWLLY